MRPDRIPRSPFKMKKKKKKGKNVNVYRTRVDESLYNCYPATTIVSS